MKKMNYFRKEVNLLKILGISLWEGESKIYCFYSISILSAITVLHPLLVLREIYVQGIENYMDYVVYEFAYFLVLSKAVVTYRNRFKLGKIIEKLHEDPFLPNFDRGGEEEQKLINTCRWINNIQTFVYWSSGTVTIVGTMIYTIIIRVTNKDYHKWLMTYGPLTVINTTYSPNYELTMLYQNFSALYSTVIFTTIDLIIASVLSHVSFQFKILQNNLRSLVKENRENRRSSMVQYDQLNNELCTISWKTLHKTQVNFVQYHNAVINMANEMENVFGQLLLASYLFTIGVICFEIYRGSTATNFLQLARALFEMFDFLVPIALISYWGEQIIFESTSVANAAFETNFIGTDLRFQKGLLLITMRSQKPVTLTAGKFVIIELFTFTWVVKKSYSAFMLIKSSQR